MSCSHKAAGATDTLLKSEVKFLSALFGELPWMYYPQMAQEKAIDGSKDSTLCALANGLYNKVTIERYDYLGQKTPTGSIAVFRQLNRNFEIPYADDGLPSCYLTKEDYALRDYFIRGSIVAAAGGKSEVLKNLNAMADALHRIHPLIWFANYNRISTESDDVRINLRLYTPYEKGSLTEMVRTLNQATEWLKEQNKTNGMSQFLRAAQTQHNDLR
jgi:hypothetical protein